MTITIELAPEVEATLREAAAQQGEKPEQYVKRLVEAQLAPAVAQTPRLWEQKGPGEEKPVMLDQTLAKLIEAAKRLEKPQSPHRGKKEAFAEILAEKYRKQGFRL